MLRDTPIPPAIRDALFLGKAAGNYEVVDLLTKILAHNGIDKRVFRMEFVEAFNTLTH